ncbi:MAG: hemerythrin domain-containing protein [Proteobacteria bacterium]|nr:hemerythrin domain-containing protein [Pseudomonadota bacterium]
MTALAWSEALALKQPRMDQTHREFVELLQQLDAAAADPARDLLPLVRELQSHTEAHFAQEERWMADIDFAAQNCHSLQHAQVLKVLAEVPRLLAEKDDRELGRVLSDELGKWFVVHAQTMDAALAELMLERGYDPDTGRLLQPLPAAEVPPALITGCGGARCS